MLTDLRDVVTEINRSVASTLKATGPSILGQKTMMDQIITVLGTITTRCHPCQQDLGDEDENQDDVQGSSEWDWLIIDTALDVLIGLAAALGPQSLKSGRSSRSPFSNLSAQMRILNGQLLSVSWPSVSNTWVPR